MVALAGSEDVQEEAGNCGADKFESGSPKRQELCILEARLRAQMGKGKYSAKTSAEGEHSSQGGRDGGGLCRAAAAGKKDCPHRAGKVGASQMLSPSHTRTDGCWETDVGWGWAQGTVCFRMCSLVPCGTWPPTTWATPHLQNHPRDAQL